MTLVAPSSLTLVVSSFNHKANRVRRRGRRHRPNDVEQLHLRDHQYPCGLDALVEFAEPLTIGAMQATLSDEDGEVVGQQVIELIAAPVLLNHHLQPAELVVSMSLDQAGGNRAFTLRTASRPGRPRPVEN